MIAGLGVARVSQRVEVSASFLVYILAGAFLGPTSAFVAAILSEVAASRMSRTRRHAFLFNLLACGFTALLAGTLLRDIAPKQHSAGFYLVLGGLAFCMLALTWVIIASFNIAYDGYKPMWSPRTLVDYIPSVLINVALVVAGAAIYVEVGVAGIAFALAAVLAFAYMAHLLDNSRQRAEQYVSLSWGVLAGLAACAGHARSARRAACRGGGAVRERHGRVGRHERAGPGAGPHRRPAPRHRPLRAVGPRGRARAAR